MYKKLVKSIIFVLLISGFILPAQAYTETDTATVSVSARVGASSQGGGGGYIDRRSSVVFNGVANSFTKVYLLENGRIVLSAATDGAFRFSLLLQEVDSGTYNFSLYGEDLNGKRSITFSFDLAVPQNAFITVDNIVLERAVEIEKENNCLSIRADINCDSRVDLIDFSILAFWYKKPNPPQKIDLNNDGAINIRDFSIMAFYWTGV